MLRRNEKEIRVDLKPEIPQKKKLKEQYERVIEQSKHYDKVFWIVDFDVIISESKLAKKGTETPVQELKKYITELKRNNDNVIVIINNPCLEFWFLLHFEATGKYFNNCESAAKQLKKHLSNYEKTSKFYTKQDNDIYSILKPKLNTAIVNAKKLKAFDLDKPAMAITQMHLLFETDELKGIAM
jgi:hypothetical protein